LTNVYLPADAALLERIKSGDQEAFSLLYRRYFAKLSHFAFRRLQDEAVTEELVMDVFFELWQQRQTLAAEGNIAGWLHATLRNKALHELRARATREKHQGVFAFKQQTATENAEAAFDARLLQERMDTAISRLSPQCREAFTLSRQEHLSYKEIAQRMGISVKTVEKHMSKALGLLREDIRAYQTSAILLAGLLEIVLQR